MDKGVKGVKGVEEVRLSGQATETQIAMWKKQHRDVFEIIAGDKVCYLKRPDRQTLKAAVAVGEQDAMRYDEIVLENCWLGGDEEIKDNDNYFLEVVPVLAEIVDYGRAAIKKL